MAARQTTRRICQLESQQRYFASSSRRAFPAGAAAASDAAESSSAPHRAGQSSRSVQEEEFKLHLQNAQQWRRRREALRIKTPFIPNDKEDHSASPHTAALSTLLASGAALGGSPKDMNQHYTQFIYGYRSGLAIIDLEKTLPLLRRTANLVRDIVKDDGVVLLVGSKPGIERCLGKAKKRFGDNGFVTAEWSPGLLTNAQSLFGLEPVLEGSHLPDLVIFLNPINSAHGIRECTLRNIPTVGIIDTPLDPRAVTYPIPANVESLRTVELIVGTLSLAGQEGRRLRELHRQDTSRQANQRDI